MDVHKRDTQICELDASGAVVNEQRLRTTRERLRAVFGGRAAARILLEASTESEWVAQALEALGHAVIVADPNYAPMYATRRRIKTDRRDARSLAEACRTGTYRAAHRTSAAQRDVRAALAVRDAVVRTRVRYIALVRSLLRQAGIAVPAGHADSFLRRLETVPLPATLAAIVAPLRRILESVNAEIAAADARLASSLTTNALARRLTTTPGVGPVTAVAFVATLDDVRRFPSAGHVAAYLGLVPQERSSGEQRHRGALTKSGNARMRWLLVQAAWNVWRARGAESEHLRAWVQPVAARRSKRVAIVALARRLARILYALWRDGTTYHHPTVTAPMAAAS